MKQITFLLAIFYTTMAIANENFEINQKNCNLPMKRIKQLLPERADQQKALKQCMEKASKEKWKRKTLLTTADTKQS